MTTTNPQGRQHEAWLRRLSERVGSGLSWQRRENTDGTLAVEKNVDARPFEFPKASLSPRTQAAGARGRVSFPSGSERPNARKPVAGRIYLIPICWDPTRGLSRGRASGSRVERKTRALLPAFVISGYGREEFSRVGSTPTDRTPVQEDVAREPLPTERKGEGETHARLPISHTAEGRDRLSFFPFSPRGMCRAPRLPSAPSSPACVRRQAEAHELPADALAWRAPRGVTMIVRTNRVLRGLSTSRRPKPFATPGSQSGGRVQLRTRSQPLAERLVHGQAGRGNRVTARRDEPSSPACGRREVGFSCDRVVARVMQARCESGGRDHFLEMGRTRHLGNGRLRPEFETQITETPDTWCDGSERRASLQEVGHG